MTTLYEVGSAIKTRPSATPFGSWWVLSDDDSELELNSGKVGIIVDRRKYTEIYSDKSLEREDEDFFLYKVLIDGVVYKDLDELMFEKL